MDQVDEGVLRARRGWPQQTLDIIDALPEVAKSWLEISLVHAALISSLDNLAYGKTINRQQFEELPPPARALLEAAWEDAQARLIRARPTAKSAPLVHAHARAPRSAQEKR